MGVVGVGRMGSAVVERLGASFPHVVAFDRDPARATEVQTHGYRWSASIAELVAESEVVVTVLPDGAAVREAMSDDVLAVAGSGTIWMDMTSGDPDTSTLMAERAARYGVGMVAAPIGGSPTDARAGDLQLFTAGPATLRKEVLPVLHALARPDGVRVVGELPGQAQTVKLLINALWFATAVATSEALLTAAGAGIAPERLQALLPDTAGATAFSDSHLPRFLAGDDFDTFGLDGIVTELRSVRQIAGGTATPVLDASLTLHEEALQRWGPRLGELLAVRLLEERAGRALRPSTSGDNTSARE